MLLSTKSKINWKYQFQQYGTAFITALFFFVVLSLYIFYRRGYYDLYIINKVFAGVSVVLLGAVILIGPGSRLFSFPDRYVQYRKELGVIAFFLAFIHVIISLFFLPSKFPLSGYLEKINLPFMFGLLATIILISIFIISNDKVMNSLGREKWWKMQYLGIRFAFILVIFHVFIMKWNSWVQWYKASGGKELVHPEWPGAGLLVGWFMFFVVIIRIAEFINPKLGKTVWYIGFIILPLVYVATFWWGRQFIN